MPKSKPPNKRSRRAGRAARREAGSDPISVALMGVSYFSAAELAELTDPAMTVLQQLRQGQGSTDVWRKMADYCNLAEALVEIGIGTNLGPEVCQAQAALRAVIERVHAGKSWTLYPAEITALTDAVDVYSAQASQSSRSEFARAVELVRRRVAGALAGNAGHKHVVHADPDEVAAC